MHAVVRIPPLLTCLALPALAGAGSAYIAHRAGETYNLLVLPRFAPPTAFFQGAWLSFYLLMGLSSYLIFTARGISRTDRNSSLSLCIFVLLSGFIWNVLFFEFGLLMLSACWVGIVFACTALCAALFYRIRPGAGALIAPGLAWIIFVGLLCLRVAALN